MKKVICIIAFISLNACSESHREECDPNTYTTRCENGTAIWYCAPGMNNVTEEAKVDVYCQNVDELINATDYKGNNSNIDEILTILKNEVTDTNSFINKLYQNNNLLVNDLCYDENEIEAVHCLFPHLKLNRTCTKMPNGELYWKYSIEECENICLYNKESHSASCVKFGDICKSEGPIGCNRNRAYYCSYNGTGFYDSTLRVAEVICDEGAMCISDEMNTSCRTPCYNFNEEILYCLYTDSYITGKCAPSPWNNGKYYPQAAPIENDYSKNLGQGICVDGTYKYLSAISSGNNLGLSCASEADDDKGMCLSNTAVFCDYEKTGYYKTQQCNEYMVGVDGTTIEFENGGRCMKKGDFPYCARPCFEVGSTTSYEIAGDFNANSSFVCEETPNGLYYILQTTPL